MDAKVKEKMIELFSHIDQALELMNDAITIGLEKSRGVSCGCEKCKITIEHFKMANLVGPLLAIAAQTGAAVILGAVQEGRPVTFDIQELGDMLEKIAEAGKSPSFPQRPANA